MSKKKKTLHELSTQFAREKMNKIFGPKPKTTHEVRMYEDSERALKNLYIHIYLEGVKRSVDVIKNCDGDLDFALHKLKLDFEEYGL